MSEEQSIGRDDRKRILALLPVLDARHGALVGVLEAMGREEDVPFWQMDLARADVVTVLTLLSPEVAARDAVPPGEDGDDPDLWGAV